MRALIYYAVSVAVVAVAAQIAIARGVRVRAYRADSGDALDPWAVAILVLAACLVWPLSIFVVALIIARSR